VMMPLVRKSGPKSSADGWWITSGYRRPAYPPWAWVERCSCDQFARRRPEQTCSVPHIQFRRLT
jgi:hypothetical protein